ncbi:MULTISPECIES: hypothetical protein [Streptococcus]|uniref:DUF1642 domain-containing protein n=1 Tax=Streptococcus caledonicus TaxID=2614158 RepID=A0ABW0UFT8_9STRE|nr:hypothetical protein [Streptococcus sp. S784/96/1]
MSKIEIIKKRRLTSFGDVVVEGDFYGIKVTNNNGTFHPIYPYALSENDKCHLEEFIEENFEDLISFYKTGNEINFCHHVFGFATEKKRYFKNYWHERGVTIC